MLKTLNTFNKSLLGRTSSSFLAFNHSTKSQIFCVQPRFNFSFNQKQNPPYPPKRPGQPPKQPNQPPQQPSKSTMSKKLFLALAAISGFGLSYYQNGRLSDNQEPEMPRRREKKEAPVSSSESPKIGGSWRLIDSKGELMTEKDLEGSYYLLYFGFCFCPDVCPESLAKIAEALDILKKEEPKFPIKKVKTVFVSIDPDRDTPEKLEKFLTMFDTPIIGLRGLSNDDPNLQDMLKKFKILVYKIGNSGIRGEAIDKDDMSYSIDHTVITYLMDKKNNCINVLSPTLTARDMANNIKKAVEENK